MKIFSSFQKSSIYFFYDFVTKIKFLTYFWILKGCDLGVILLKIFFAKTAYIGVKSCEKSIARIPEAWKCFLDPDSGK